LFYFFYKIRCNFFSQYADLKQGVINRPLLFSTSSSNPSRSGRGGMNNDYEVPYNTYGLSTSFLEGLGIQGPLHTKVFVANVSIIFYKTKPLFFS